MSVSGRSGCPINLTIETIGDRWSLVVIRDIMFGNKRHFRELLTGSLEGIASNVLADRLKQLMKSGLLSRRDDPSHAQKAIYSLTEAAIQLVPLLVHMGAWGCRNLPADSVLSARALLLEKGGPELWESFMEELREVHLGTVRKIGHPSVRETLQKAYLEAQMLKANTIQNT